MRRKYRAIRTEVNGHVFPSKKEARRYMELLVLQRAGVITNLELQPKYRIDFGDVHICNYIADFRYVDEQGFPVIEDVKGIKTPVYRLKAKMMLAVYGIRILET